MSAPKLKLRVTQHKLAELNRYADSIKTDSQISFDF